MISPVSDSGDLSDRDTGRNDQKDKLPVGGRFHWIRSSTVHRHVDIIYCCDIRNIDGLLLLDQCGPSKIPVLPILL